MNDHRIFSSSFCLLAYLCIWSESAYALQTDYPIPDGFTDKSGFHMFNSWQTIISGKYKKTDEKVTEFLSLEKGLSFSLHESTGVGGRKYAILSDGIEGRSYIVSNPHNGPGDNEEVFCELDVVHSHRYIFPWQYEYELEVKSDGSRRRGRRGKRGKNKNNTTNSASATQTKSSVYGVGAIWLNAIKLNITTKDVNSKSPIEHLNEWFMAQGDLEVKLDFERINEDDDSVGADNSRLHSIEIKRRHKINAYLLDGNSMEDEIIQIKLTNDAQNVKELMEHFEYQLEKCRQSTVRHRIFPSLLAQINMSPERMYAMEYITRKYPLFGETTSGYDEARHRQVHDTEFNVEWFSFKREAQVLVYEPLPVMSDLRADVFLRLLTARAGKRSSRHAHLDYHFYESDGEVKNCTEHENEPYPSGKQHMFARPVHFYRNEGDIKLSGLIRGLGALLMNAEDSHYKQFNLFTKTVGIRAEPYDIGITETIEVDEWQITDTRSGWSFHFFFDRDNSKSAKRDVTSLRLIEVRDTTVAQKSNLHASARLQDDESDLDLVVRFDIVKFITNPSTEEVDFKFTPPDKCHDDGKADESDKDSNSDDDDDDSYNGSFDDNWTDNWNDIDSDSDSDSDNEHDEKHDQEMGEMFETDPGRLIETHDIPSFYEYVEGYNSYEILSRINVRDGKNSRKYIYLKETFVSSIEMFSLKVYSSQRRLELDEAELEYIINYHSELVFEILPGSEQCFLAESVLTWLRLISTSHRYIVTSKTSGVDGGIVRESTDVRQYGIAGLWKLASESQSTYFKGMKKKPFTGSDGNQYKQVLWSLTDEDDEDFEYSFSFYFNETKYQQDKARKSLQHRSKYLHLDSISTNRLDDSEEQNFQMVDMVVLRIRRSNKIEIELPAHCYKALAKADQIAAMRDTQLKEQTKFPTFHDYIFNSNAYKIDYFILAQSNADNDHTRRTFSIEEEYNRQTHRGRIKISGDRGVEQIFIEAQDKSIYQYKDSYSPCKKVTELKPLFELQNFLDLSNNDFDENKLYGLAGLWTKLSELPNYKVTIKHSVDNQGHRHEKHIYTNYFGTKEFPRAMAVEVTFVKRLGLRHGNSTIKVRYEDDFLLPAIEIWPNKPEQWLKKIPGVKLDKAFIVMNKVVEPEDWKLPDNCVETHHGTDTTGDGASHVTPTGDSSGQNKGEKASFPKIVNLIQYENFHMRSEVVITSGTSTYLYLLDEWITKDKIRMKSHRLKFDFDLLIFTEGREIFDISVPYSCIKQQPSFHFMEHPRKSDDLLNFWKSNSTKIEWLSNLYYGPLTLWALATRDEINVQLIESVEIIPMELGPKDLDEMEKELRTEVWRVSSQNGLWSYDMKFEKVKQDRADGTAAEWHVLDSIQAFDKDATGRTFVINVDVVNYRYTHTDQETLDIFRLPDGYGCTRDGEQGIAIGEVFTTLQNNGGRVYYEASLELLDPNDEDPELGSINVRKQVLPSLSGTFIRTPKELNFEAKSFAHLSRTRHINGTFRATKVVYDASNSLLYEIDKVTGFCKIGLVFDADWSLDFPREQRVESIVINEEKFKLLFLETHRQGFKLVNSYETSDVTTTSYELQVEDFSLGPNLSGTARIIRYFRKTAHQYPHFLEDEKRYVSYHDSVAVKVLLFNSLRNKVLAVLSISVRIQDANTASGLDGILQSLNVAQCFNDGDQEWDRASESFVLEYQIAPALHFLALLTQNQLKTTIYKALLKYAQVSPLQLDGNIRIELSGNSMLLVHFNMIDAPTAYLYFRERTESRMTEKMELKSELRFSGSVADCSKWCDQSGCLAMSYCSDRTCRILPEASKRQASFSNEQAHELASCVSDSKCSYYYRVRRQAPSLEKFTDLMTRTVNLERDPQKLAELAIDLSYAHLVPAQFYDSRKKFITSDVDLDNPRSLAKDKNTYYVSRRDFRLDAAHLEAFNSEQHTEVKAYHVPHPTYNDCLTECKLSMDECIVASFCKENSECTIFSGKADAKRLMERTGSNSTGCSVTVRDFTPEYEKFASVSPPHTHMAKLEHYSAIECAAACRASRIDGNSESNCLSFDWCRPEPAKEQLGDDSELEEVRQVSTCYLQQTHITQDSFPRHRVESYGNETTGEQSCDHYSRNAIYDYMKLANKKLIHKVNAVLRGISADRCAIDCEEDEECKAFEYCYNVKLQPAQSCYLVRSSEILDTSSAKELDKQLKNSKSCSMFVLQGELAQPMSRQVGRVDISFFQKAVFTLLCIFGAILAGAIVQTVYIRVMGRPLIFDR